MDPEGPPMHPAVSREEDAASVVAARWFRPQFTGTAAEYFRIWIVNTFLTIVTLGIYSAWAKVRRMRYFYGSTFLDGVSFEYLADPVRILKGRLLVCVLFVAYSIVSNLVPVVGSLLGLLFAAFIPWIAVKALRFRTRNTSYRNVRFDFRGAYSDALGVYTGGALLAGITLGLGLPYFAYMRHRFTVEHAAFGKTPFTFTATARAFYGVYVRAGLLTALVGIGALVLFAHAAFSRPGPSPGGLDANAAWWFPLLILAPPLVYTAFMRAAIPNLVWSNTRSGEHRFVSTLRPSRMIWIYLSNAAAIVLSAGLLIPWAHVRLTRYRLDNLWLLAVGDLDGYAAAEGQGVGAAGEEMSEFFDIDVGI